MSTLLSATVLILHLDERFTVNPNLTVNLYPGYHTTVITWV
jgi:hypothetical protein